MTALYHPRPERWPQVSLKGFFVLVTLLCVFLGWLGVQFRWIHDRNEAFKWVPDASDSSGYLMGFEGSSAPWSVRLLGEPGFGEIWVRVDDVEHPTERDQAAKRAVEVLFPEAYVRYSDERWVTPGPQRRVPSGRIHGGGVW